MICPACHNTMIVVEHNKIELDYCTRCRGVWLDAGEMELLLESMGVESPADFINNILSSPEHKASEKVRKCPICGHKMKETSVGEQPEVLVDVCQARDGLWFDSGEVHQMIQWLASRPGAEGKPQQKVFTFLGEVFKARD